MRVRLLIGSWVAGRRGRSFFDGGVGWRLLGVMGAGVVGIGDLSLIGGALKNCMHGCTCTVMCNDLPFSDE